MSINLSDALTQLTVLQKAISTAVGDSNAEAFTYPHTYGVYPYWFNRIDTWALPSTTSVRVPSITFNVQMWLIVDKGGYEGDIWERVYNSYIPQTIAYFTRRQRLETTFGKTDGVPDGLEKHVLQAPGSVAQAAFLESKPFGVQFPIQLVFKVR